MKVGTKKMARRIDNKRARAAQRQALEGGNPRTIRKSRWSTRPYETPVTDEGGISNPPKPRRKRKGRKEIYCKSREGQRRHVFGAPVKRTSESPITGASVVRAYSKCKFCGYEKRVFIKLTD